MSEVIAISNAETLQAINRAEIDIQIATAHAYPRDLRRVLNTIETYATMDVETAEDCFYALRRGSGDDRAVIEGVSVRLAEIFAGAWGNIRVQTRIIGNDGRTITAQGICHDLETNYATSVEVKRRIIDRNGRTFSEDMQVVTGNAASAIAFRNAVLKVIPKAVTKKIINNIKQVALGQSIDLETSRQRALQHFAKLGVTEQQVLAYLEVKSVAEIDKEKVFELRSLSNAIKEGTTTVADTFKAPATESKPDATTAAKSKVEEAMKGATQPKADPTKKNPEPGIDAGTKPKSKPVPKPNPDAPKGGYPQEPELKMEMTPENETPEEKQAREDREFQAIIKAEQN